MVTGSKKSPVKSAPKSAKEKAPMSAKPKKEKAPRIAKERPAASSLSTEAVDPRNPLQKRRLVQGTVVSDKMQKTIVVKVDRRVRHGLYQKYIVRSRRFKAHDENNEYHVGDTVEMQEGKPVSKEKNWNIIGKIK